MDSTFRIKLKRQTQVASGTGSFYFEKPNGFDYEAGQFVEMTLDGVEEASDADRVHSFTLCSAPCEDDLMITTRLRDSIFKQTLRALKPSDEVVIEGPYGTFTLREDTPRPVVLIAGGVGITPMRSLLTQAAVDGRLDDVFLFYSNRTPDECAFFGELDELQKTHGGFHFVPTMSGLTPEHTDWQGERGRVDFGLLSRYVDPVRACFYVSGPPGLVGAMRTMLAENGIERQNIRVENFDGY